MKEAGWSFVLFGFFFAKFGSYLWDVYIKYKIDGYMPLRGLAVKYERLRDGGATQGKEPGCLSFLLRRTMQESRPTRNIHCGFSASEK